MRCAKPGEQDRVFKSECMFSFDTPLSEGGLFVNMRTFQGFSAEYVEADHKKFTATFVRVPSLDEVPYPVQMEPNLVVEYYSR